jgi:hypothetical protein
MLEGDLIAGKRPLKPDEVGLLEETKDYVVYPVLVPTPAPVAASGALASVLPEQGATRRAFI